MPTQKQIAVRQKFKEKFDKAKAIKSRHPNMKYSTAVKIAWGKMAEPKTKNRKKNKTKGEFV